ncbi:protealysin inhibitor emfourin [Parvularcula dongshanensis]|uniref:Uncharacterized protein n=1 Tax=Parvularcula dongshanensis TaxID=1173995 RepID=A0A840I7A9_9PROT|nr:protealysin inhibitor emfourin [Parvularcula dongshanensis]MBB4660151.1 hypothetical protein [Parvularcula dongshanensis]
MGTDGTPVSGEASLTVEGGVAVFPGLSRTRTLRLEALPVAEARAVEELARRAAFFDGAETTPAPARPDARTYRLCLTIGGRRRERCIAEPVADPALAELIACVQRLTRSA